MTASKLDTAQPELDLTTQRGRVAAWCRWFDLEEPKLKYRKGDLLTSSVGWIGSVGASIDWIVCGDPKSMAIAYRKSEQERRGMLDALRKLEMTEAEMSALLLAMRTVAEDGVDVEEALQLWKQAVYDRRENPTTAAQH
ncbi:hypothetical protein ACFO5X_24330 [Seohaeicola nanhaiensis]|uniref:Uncharacterized protein n=1 Tax=Seohaeicola nanhaiensis TaxID=1387282 RepID=A0ABV9KQ37_9RHOB